MDKKALRNYYLQLRLNLSEAERVQGSQRMCDLFFIHIDLAFVKTIHLYLPIKKKAEPDTWLILERLKREFPQIRIAVPKIDTATSTMKSYLFDRNHLNRNDWGIEEPTSGQEIRSSEIDVVIVPLLIFDKSGHRVGYGKGFYDKFLSGCRPEIKKIGLSFFEPVDRIPFDHHDHKLTSAITPRSFFTF